MNAVFSVWLSEPSGSTVTVAYATADGTALAGSDYLPATGTLTFLPSVLTRSVSVPVTGDTLYEADEVLFLNLSNPTNAALGDGQGVATVVNDDPLPRVVISEPVPAATAEGDPGEMSPRTFLVSLSAASALTTTVSYASSDGSASTLGNDYLANAGQITFLAGETVKPVIVTVVGDRMREPDEAFVVNLSAPINATIEDGQATATILNDDPVPIVYVSDAALAEGNSGSTSASFDVTLSNPTWQTITVPYATSAGSATSAADYTDTAGTVTFAPGQTVGSFLVAVHGDVTHEADETFVAALGSPSPSGEAAVGDGQAQGTIFNDDNMPAFSVVDLTVTEGTGGTAAAEVTVSLSAASGVTASVQYATADGSALSPGDYAQTSGELAFAPGITTLTIGIPIVGDARREPSESFHVNLSNASGAFVGDGTATVTITDDDVAPSRVFVSVLGLDSNDCSDVHTPCRTLNAALSQVAEEGEVVVTRSGSYAGATVTKGVKIDVAAGVVAFSGQPIVVNPGPSAGVVIRGMTLKAAMAGMGTGIVHQSGVLFLERAVVDGWQRGLSSTSAGKLFVTDSTLRNNVEAGVSLTWGEASIEGSRLVGNGSGLELGSGKATVNGSMFSGNAVGLSADGVSDVSLDKTQLGSNATAGILLPVSSSATVRLNRCVVSGNGVGLQNENGTIVVTGTNVVKGNGTDTQGTITGGGLQ
jgi:hypothetical protein